MLESKWFKSILYSTYTVACAFSGYLIYYAAKNGTLYTAVLDHLLVKALIVGIPVILCIIMDMIYHPYDIFEGFAWTTSLGSPFVCLLIGYLLIGNKQEINIFGLTIPATVIYVLMYTLSLVVTYLAGLLGIWAGEDERPKKYPSPTYVEPYTPPTAQPECGPGGMPIEMGPNYIPHSSTNSPE